MIINIVGVEIIIIIEIKFIIANRICWHCLEFLSPRSPPLSLSCTTTVTLPEARLAALDIASRVIVAFIFTPTDELVLSLHRFLAFRFLAERRAAEVRSLFGISLSDSLLAPRLAAPFFFSSLFSLSRRSPVSYSIPQL